MTMVMKLDTFVKKNKTTFLYGQSGVIAERAITDHSALWSEWMIAIHDY